MSRLEDELRKALRREEPPAGFAERLIARAAASPPRIRRWRVLTDALRAPAFRWASAAAIVVLLVTGVHYQREREAQARGEAAKVQLVLALQITGSKLQFAQEKVLALTSAREMEPSSENGAHPSSFGLHN